MAFVDIPIKQSSNIQRVEHDAETLTLRVHVKGGVYDHSGVDLVKANGFSTADSAGSYYHTHFSARGPSAGVHPHSKVG